MTVYELYQRAIHSGIQADPRGRDAVTAHLRREQQSCADLPHRQREYFDNERLVNPYADSRILTGDQNRPVKRLLVGIDIHTAEVLLATELSRTGRPIDLLISHHPEGKALAALDQVMHLQTEMFAQVGVPINIADALMKKRSAEVARGLSPDNHNQSVDAARLLGLPFLCIHTPADNRAWRFVQQSINRRQPEMVGEVLDLLYAIPEYAAAAELGAAPQLVVGTDKNWAGRVLAIEFTGGTNYGKEMYEHLARAGVGTIVSMHMKEEHRSEAEKYHINCVIAPHIASDSLGMNLILDEFAQAGIEIVPCSGFIRIERKRRGRKPGSRPGASEQSHQSHTQQNTSAG